MCREGLIIDIHEKLEPATVVCVVLMGFVFATLFYVATIAYDASGQTPKLIIFCAYFLNFVLLLAGVALTVLSILGDKELAKECPEGAECSNFAITLAKMTGIVVAAVAMVTELAIWKNVKLFLKLAMVGEAIIIFILMMLAIFLSIISGGMQTINAEAEKHFPVLRAQYEQKDQYYCTTKDAGGSTLPMTDENCRLKIKEDIEGNVLVVGLSAFGAALVMIAAFVFTFRLIKSLGRQADSSLISMVAGGAKVITAGTVGVATDGIKAGGKAAAKGTKKATVDQVPNPLAADDVGDD